ncbi:DUF2846 domain-containing protein [Neisseria chenwenguii]|uniref:Uncharacterized protein n=1 Tax=Neisseria chenwenguii TaxID=1853278 RepID=A0A220S0J2_9NEIS|nr:DUF2846 domain-containing protein [Neisseria chenwenguii]ASK26886.1 hypothetical protein BG910_03230 [Neisseria chenwenguii]ROV56861.1 DUF2846 domain-containing protein [Neisseria chenwenguii]
MNKTLTAAALSAVLALSGCASVALAPQEASAAAKTFNLPAEGMAGLYVYRDSFVGQALKKDIWVDGKCLGESSNKVFFRTEVAGGQSHEIATESEFSPNKLTIAAEAGKNYFVRQYIKMGAFVGGAHVELVDEAQGKAAVSKLNLATQGNCSKPAQ